MKIREISPGTDGLDNSYVEVQMYAPGQIYLAFGAKLVVCNATCSLFPATFSPFANVPNGANQSTVVFGDSGVASTSKDFNVNLSLDLNRPGGAACYVSELGFSDCVSWGSFSANSTLTANYDASADPGSPAPALASGMALRRSISAGCPTALEAGDDTNSSAADFAAAAPNPRPNSMAPTEMSCGVGPTGYPTQPNAPGAKRKRCRKPKRTSGGGNSAYSAKKRCKKKRK